MRLKLLKTVFMCVAKKIWVYRAFSRDRTELDSIRVHQRKHPRHALKSREVF